MSAIDLFLADVVEEEVVEVAFVNWLPAGPVRCRGE